MELDRLVSRGNAAKTRATLIPDVYKFVLEEDESTGKFYWITASQTSKQSFASVNWFLFRPLVRFWFLGFANLRNARKVWCEFINYELKLQFLGRKLHYTFFGLQECTFSVNVLFMSNIFTHILYSFFIIHAQVSHVTYTLLRV